MLEGLVRYKQKWVNEWLEQKEYALDLFKNIENLPSTTRQELVIIFIDLFWGSIGEHEGVSHPESEVWKESPEITLMHTSVREPRTLLDPQESLSTPFARDEQSLGVGVCWRSISMIFTANIPSNFMFLELYYYDFY